MERKWGNDNLNGVAWKASAVHDKDGSLGGVPNSYILIHDGAFDSIATDPQACEIKPAWNAAVCKGDIGRLTFGGSGGAAPRFGGAAPRVPVVPVPRRPPLPLLVVGPAVVAQRLLSRQSFSPATVGSTPKPQAMYDLAPKSR